MKVKCNGCGHIDEESAFPKGRDFFQNTYVAECPTRCGNSQSPGGASMRMGNSTRPFEYVTDVVEPVDPLAKTLHRAGQAS